MPDVLFILPGADGSPNPYGEEFRHSCSENDPISSLFDVIRTKLGRRDVHLSFETASRDFEAGAEIDPKDPRTLSAIGLPGRRVIVSF
jgi:hypothetical protein